MRLIRKPDWALPESAVTPEALYLDRRKLLKTMGFIGGASLIASCDQTPVEAAPTLAPFKPTPTRNPDYADAGASITDESLTSSYNNFYEFGSHKHIAKAAQALQTDGWRLHIDGEVEKPLEIGADDLIAKMQVEERIYRHRCVEAWSMVVPWIGFPLADLMALAKPLSSARYLRFEGFEDPKTAPGQKAYWYPWPYAEGITIEEAANELPLIVVGAYGKVMAKQFGAPLRLHLPWKYGFKSIKSITRITFSRERPVSFWETLAADEYGFWANVNPKVNHPRWSQASERPLSGGERIPTRLFNGYGAQVASLYTGLEAKYGDALYH